MSTENHGLLKITPFAKIGDWIKRNQGDVVLMAGYILVALIAFGAGRLSAPALVRNPLVIEESREAVGTSTNSAINLYGAAASGIGATGVLTEQAKTNNQVSGKGMFVASKSGKKYYWPWSSWAKRIKLENQVWFNSEKEAMAAGYSKSADFDQSAPAGYKNSY